MDDGKNDGRKLLGEWVTSLPVNRTSGAQLVRYARRRWNIENCVFKTLKAQSGTNFEHNFGHGKQCLADNLGQLMMVAALLDQVCYLRCQYFGAIRLGFTAWPAMWELQRACLSLAVHSDWREFYESMLGGLDPPKSTA